MGLKEWIARKLIEREGNNMFDKLRNAVSGYKTYITAGLGILVLLIGHFWGPMTIAGATFPQVDNNALWKGIWEAVSLIFLRAGVAKQGAV